MRDDFCVFILTHGRPDKVLTYRTLRRAGYTGKIFIVVDDEDKTRNSDIIQVQLSITAADEAPTITRKKNSPAAVIAKASAEAIS
ncbi:TPA: hypothetical protein J5F60_004390 [Escherichia coli]|nr:hypothetical protein [Escherichia coli]HBB8455904.1 hypothetical protein [Escherichia coli]